MIGKRFKLNLITFSTGLAMSTLVCASPWIETNDQYLKASVTALANAGIITTPVNTYPLMYKSIAADLQKAHKDKIPEHLKYALLQLEHAMKHAQKARTSGVKLKVASDNNQFQSFGERYNAKGELNIFNEVLGNNWAVKTSVQFSRDAENGKKRSYEGSYFAGIFDNWIVGVDQLSQWWGPGNDSSLALSNNAVAFPAVRLTRHHNAPIDFPVLNWLGPVSFTTYFGMQEHSNELDNIRLWGARLNFRPVESLEIGLTRTAQWGGRGRPRSFSNFVDLMIGRDNAGVDAEVTAEEEPGNQLGGIDFRYSQMLFDMPWGFYGEIIGEDESGGLPSHLMHQFGIETSFGDKMGLYHLFAEYSDTYVQCGVANNASCAYEHHIYTEGYRRYHRSMGSTYDNDANVLTVGLSRAEIGGVSWYSKLKWMKLNKDNQNNISAVNPVSPIAQDRVQLEGGYRFPLMKGLFSVEATLFHNKQSVSGITDTDGSLRASWEYRF